MVDLITDDESFEAIELLYRSYRSFTDRADRLLDKRGLNRAHHRILYFVARNKNGSVATLLEALAITKQALNVPLRQLVSMGLVDSQRSSTDARVKILGLTVSGKRLEARLTHMQAELLNDVFTVTGPQAEDGWRQVMRVLSQN